MFSCNGMGSRETFKNAIYVSHLFVYGLSSGCVPLLLAVGRVPPPSLHILLLTFNCLSSRLLASSLPWPSSSLSSHFMPHSRTLKVTAFWDMAPCRLVIIEFLRKLRLSSSGKPRECICYLECGGSRLRRNMWIITLVHGVMSYMTIALKTYEHTIIIIIIIIIIIFSPVSY